ncbi:MAG: hypothetical protein OHK0023_18960 [Anaerolineae bacterium]
MFIRLFAILAVIFTAFLIPTPAQAGGVVTNCSNQSDLQSKLAGGGTVTFNCGTAVINITSTLEITAANTVIDGGGTITLQGTTNVRMINHRTLTDVPSHLTIRNMTIQNASLTGNGEASNGAAIRSVNNSFAPPQYPQTLVIENVTFSNNTSSNSASGGNGYDFGGGAIFTQGGILEVRNSTFTGNRALRGAGAAIHGLRSNITIENSTFTGGIATSYSTSNTSSGYGGALYVDGALSSGNGFVRISNSTFTGNSAANQGGFAYVNLYTAQNESFWLDGSTVSNNTVSGGGMGLGGAFSGGGTNNGAGTVRLTFTNNLFSGNQVSGGTTGASGGALGIAQTAQILVANNTFTNNRANGVCTTCYNANGGAIYIVNNTVPYQIINNTIIGNYAGWVGGGITASTSGSIRNTIIANNTADNGGNPWNIQQNCGMTATQGGNNLQYPPLHPTDSNDRRCTSNTTISNPQVGTLGNHGGPTQTIPILAGSPAIDTGDKAICTAAPLYNLDQRGRVRLTTANSLCDIGAFEYNGPVQGDVIGLYRPSIAHYMLRNALADGVPDQYIWFGASGDLPVVGDWDGNGTDTVGLFRNGLFFLKESNASNAGINYFTLYGAAGDLPVAGDWNNDGRDGIGVYRPSEGVFFLVNSVNGGFPDHFVQFGTLGDVPVIGDWNGDGVDSVGVFRASVGAYYLSNTMCGGCSAPLDYAVGYGAPGDVPIVGDWNGDNVTGIGIYRAGIFFLRETPTTGLPDMAFAYGANTDRFVAGKWSRGGITGYQSYALTPPTSQSAPIFVPR